jgi:hypothetical protein
MAITNFAEEVYRSQSDGLLVPRQKFNFTMWVMSITAGPIYFHQVSSMTAPSFSVDGSLMNQYNKKRFVQTTLNYEPITVTFYDTFNNEFHNLMRNYLSFYYNNANGIEWRTPLEGTSTIDPNFITDLGYTPNADRYFFPEIRIIQNGYRNRFRETRLINPHITNIQNDELNYSDSQPVQYTVTFQPESVQTRQETGPFDDGIGQDSAGTIE